MNKTLKKKLLITGVSSLIFVSGFGAVAGNFLYDFALNSEVQRNRSATDKGIHDDQTNLAKWLQQVGTHTDEYVSSFNGVKLHAYQIKQDGPTDKWIILAHGYTNSPNGMSDQAKHFYDLGFNILIPDARGHGLSEGHYIGMGWDERRDIVQWTKTIVEQNQQAQIALYGVSMGAATVMNAAGEADLPQQVKLVIEDCGFSSISGVFEHQLGAQFGLPAFPFLNFANIVTRVRAGFWFTDGNVVKQVSQSNLPMLFIHGTEDDYVPTAMVDEVYEAAQGPKEKLLVAKAEHAKSLSVDPELYWNTVDAFVAQYLD